MLNKLMEWLIRIKLRIEPEWLATTFEIDEITTVHIAIERCYADRWEFGTKTEYYKKFEEVEE